MTRASKKTWLISDSLGTRPSSSCSATAILALRRRFFCSLVAIYQSSISQPVQLVKLRYIDCDMSCDTCFQACYRYQNAPSRDVSQTIVSVTSDTAMKSSDTISASLPGQRQLISTIVRRTHRQTGGNGGGCRGMAAGTRSGTVRGGIPRQWRRCRGVAHTDGQGAQGHRCQFNPPPPAPAGGDRQTSEW